MPGPFDYLNGIALFKGVKKFDNLYDIIITDGEMEISKLKSGKTI